MVIYRHGAPAGVADIAFARRDLTFDYVALHFTDPPRNRYFYHLDGYDNGWQGPTDELSARYTNLAPGPYLFRVKAESSYGVPSNDEATFAFVIRPPFYATAWFRALAALVVALALFGAFQLRVRSLRGRQAALEREVAERTRELQAALDTLGRQAQALKELDEAKSRFFSNVSHEFRTPLTLTIGPLRDVRDGRHGSIPAEALAEIDTAIENTGRQLELVDQLMALARMDAGRVEFRPRAVRLDECVRHAAAPFEALARRQEVSLGVDVGAGALQASLDEQKLERVIANLLGNALKFTPPGGTVVIGLASEGDGWATIDVEDTGPGIPPQDLPHVFERFYRGGQEGGHVPGTGIGLALAREYVDLHGGEIHASNRPGGGTRFTVRLRVVAVAPAVASASGVPAGDASAAAEPAAAVEPAGAGGLGSAAEPDEQANAGLPTVLVIDDHADMRAYVRKHLAPQYRVIEAARADAALDLVRAQLPDAVVCDVMMPGMDGYAFCRAVKSDPETDFLPVILLTARADAEGRLEGLEGGADDYLTKPFEPAELLARVRNLLRSRERLKARLAEAAPPTPMPAPPVLATPRAVPSAEEVLLGRLREAFDRAAQDEGFDVGALADALGMSRAQLHRRVKEAFDSTPAELIIRYRLERAAQLLEARAGNVAEVAYAVGFKNVSHFVKRFGAHYGQTPAAYAAAAATAGQPSEAEQRVAGPPPNSGLASGRNS
jgi:signal transduction histidine kinase/DNA-binding NarL/FixJ family response regulator